MRFFIDFEATQFSERIINIGCIADNGATFSTLVKPTHKKDKVTKFITELTGITNEMLAAAPSADEAFNAFFDFVLEQSPMGMNQYYCYGDSDTGFIGRTIGDMRNTRAIAFAKMLQHSLIDYSGEVKSYFQVCNNIALRKVYALIQAEDVVQHHDALEDAQMLFAVVNNLKNKCVPEDKGKFATMPKTEKPVPNPANKLKRAPERFVDWPSDKFEADTGNADNWVIKGILGTKIKYFDSMETAILWVMRYMSSNMSPKNLTHYEIVRNKIEKGINGNIMSYNVSWSRNNDNVDN